MTYVVKLQQFEGPLALLLELIEAEKLKITEISLAKVTDQYLEYLKCLEVVEPRHLVEFLVVASRLILIKSRAILPTLELDEEEEDSIKDLERRLEEYKKFREAAKVLAELFAKKTHAYSRELYKGMTTVFCPPQNLTPEDLCRAFQKILNELPKEEVLVEEKIAVTVSLEEKIKDLIKRIQDTIEASFKNLIAGAATKTEIILTFLAMLELIKQQTLVAQQGELFGDIKLKKCEQLINPVSNEPPIATGPPLPAISNGQITI